MGGYWVGGERSKARAVTTHFQVPAALPDARVPDLISAVEDLIEVLRQRELAPVPRERAVGGSPADAGSGALDGGQLLAQFERIALQLERTGPGLSAAQISASGSMDRSGMIGGTAARAELVKGDEGTITHGILLDHLLWTQEDLLRTYGSPDEAYSDDNGVRWFYRDAGDGGRDVVFTFVDGRVQTVN